MADEARGTPSDTRAVVSDDGTETTRAEVAPAPRVHLVELPKLVEDAVRLALEGTPSEVVSGAPESVNAGRATIVVTSEQTAERGSWCADLLRRWPEIAILTIRPADSHGTLFELWPRRRELGRLSGERIAAAAAAVTPWAQRLAGQG
jgi:hypothetical protein